MKIAILTTDNREPSKDYANPVPHFGTAPDALLQGLALLPDLDVHVVTCAQQPMRSPEKIERNIWFHSLRVPRLGWLRTGYQGCIRATRRKLQDLQPDLVHGQGTERECGISAVLSRFPNVLTIHGNMRLIARLNQARPFSYGWLAARLEAFTLPRSGGVICITRYTQNAVSDLARRTWVVPNAVHSSFFDLQPLPDAARTVLCVGNISYRKNQNAFIQALDGWAPAKPAKVVFLGQAEKSLPYAARFFNLLQSRPWCVYAGFAGREKLQQHLQHASVLALPSLEDNCPMAVLEAMAAGVPVVAARVGGLPELLTEGETGFFCDPQKPDSMRAAVEKALLNPSETRRLAGNAQLRARERFHPRVVAQRHVEIYREVLQLGAMAP